MMKHDSNPTTTTTTTTATVCGHCGVEERKLLHNVCIRSNFRRLCTTCVLRLHAPFFCPACLGVYDRSPPEDAVVCYKCYSSSHPTCVSSTAAAASIAASRGPSPCSSCLNPNALVLNLTRVENGSRSGGGRAIDKNAARLLLAAGKIAAMSMSKAEVATAAEAEKRSKEASYTKKRAREALDHVVYLMAKEKRVNAAAAAAANAVVVDSGIKKAVVNVNASGGVVAVVPAVIVNNNNNNNKVVVDASSNEVLEALNAVELKETVKSVENGVVVMEVDVVNGKDSGVNSVVENGVNSGVNGKGLEKVNAMEENIVSSLKH